MSCLGCERLVVEISEMAGESGQKLPQATARCCWVYNCFIPYIRHMMQ